MRDLIERLERATGVDTALDVEIEIALFNPDVAVRTNSAGTKVIYTKRDGTEVTHWADDWTLGPERRARTLALLRSIAQEGERE